MRGLHESSPLLFGVLALAVQVCVPRVAAGQELWLATEVEVAGDTGGAAVVDRVADSLRQHGQKVIAGMAASAAITQKHSRPPVRLQSDELVQFDKTLRVLADHLASENWPEARAVLDRLAEVRTDSLDFLNRQSERARRRFQICLLTGHLLAKVGEKKQSMEQVRKCARDFPGLEPQSSPYLPSSMRLFFDRAIKKLRTIPAATVDITVEKGRGAEQCRALINGIDAGPTPATVSPVRADQVRIQVECGEGLGRIYEVALKPGRNAVAIDPSLDRALSTRGPLKLSYPDATQARDSSVDHALQLARAIGADHALAVMNGELLRIDVDARKVTARGLFQKGSPDDLMGDLIEGRASAPQAAEAPAPASKSKSEHVEAPSGPTQATSASAGGGFASSSANTNRDDRPSSGSLVGKLAWVSAGGALVGGLTGLVAWRLREAAVASEIREAERKLNPADAQDEARRKAVAEAKLRDVENAETVMIAGLIAGGGLAVLATVLFVVDSQHDDSSSALRSCGAGPGDIGVSCRVAF